ncbi:MAG TPA: 16S rRNA (adenine(1518)-N(6)/adenine(1519)-N(6))-dimethyltransferase RsmA [Candidatus Sulfotelmatobacter sp.]|jgi:16S rRNA (adenine1518-N6/adenine1519-N6)-dimethyltransferase|nr:16S rRNA (adenine(1518)-N(6)/adenine(1519)-N(6))-dimethyltransferase RsmA [Candidatus Sulfotelmatobacter sp.]
MARQKLGQHFLSDAGWREKIARAIGVSAHGMEVPANPAAQNYCWIEIGAGHGEMTEYLVRSGVPVYAVELDPPLIARLQRFTAKHPNLTIVPGDVLETDLRSLAAGRRIRIYGNLPYYITSPILHRFFSFADQIDEIQIVIQLEVALRLAAQPGNKDYGYLSVATQFYTRPEFVFKLPPGAFSPPPEVASALVTLRLPGPGGKSGVSNAEDFLDFVKSCFGQKRKTLSNNLRQVAKPQRIRELLKELNLREDARAEQLSVAQFAAVYRAISSANPPDDPDSRT